MFVLLKLIYLKLYINVKNIFFSKFELTEIKQENNQESGFGIAKLTCDKVQEILTENNPMNNKT